MVNFLRFSPSAETSHQVILGPVLDTALYALPDLERLDIRNWPLYGVAPGLPALVWPLLMALAYIGVMLALSVGWFKRRDFV